MTNYYTHSGNEHNDWHLLREHLEAVGHLAEQFAEKNNIALKEAAYWSGLLHNLGKYRDEFQQYLKKERDRGSETHHAVYGAALAYQNNWLGPAFAIAGHHAGLHDLDQLQTLICDTRYRIDERLLSIVKRFEKELGTIVKNITEPHFVVDDPHRLEFYARMLFSTLIDADFLDTETHYTGKQRDSLQLDTLLVKTLLQRLIEEKNSKPQTGELNAVRSRLFQQCLDKAEEKPGFFH
ncbi:MAG: CRISPR-associated endonuclease Cas3'' [Methylococcales bacterium]|nr:CRISPR-associated endonuclease Cas3'' [Methylococcales bacterium]